LQNIRWHSFAILESPFPSLHPPGEFRAGASFSGGKMKLFIVKITRLVVCADERQARELATKADNPEDVDKVVEAIEFGDIPEAWRKFCPYGAGDDQPRGAAEWWQHLYGGKEAT